MTIVAIGSPGSGKSRFLKRLLSLRLQEPRCRAFVYCPHRSDIARFRDDLLLRGLWISDGAALLRAQARGALPRLIVAYRPDDLDALALAAYRARPSILYLDETIDACTRTTWTSEGIRRIWAEHRHQGVEAWFALHRPADVPRVVTAHATVTLLFKLYEPRDLRFVADRYGSGYADALRRLECPTWHPLIWPHTAGLDMDAAIG